MRISVLIATLDRTALLEKCAASLLRNTRPADEIILADQGQGAEWNAERNGFARYAGRLVHLRVPYRGKARALNEAIRVSTGDLLALTDDDVEVDSRWLETIDAVQQQHADVPAFCGRVLPEPGTDPTGYLNLVTDTEPRWITKKINPIMPSFCGANAFVRRSAMLAVGAYNGHFGPGGPFHANIDGELAYRLMRGTGRPIRFDPALVVYHSGWRRESENLQLTLNYSFGIGAFAGYYLRRGDLRPTLYLLRRCLSRSRRALRGLIPGKQTAQTADATVQLRGFRKGFLKGLSESHDGTMRNDEAR